MKCLSRGTYVCITVELPSPHRCKKINWMHASECAFPAPSYSIHIHSIICASHSFAYAVRQCLVMQLHDLMMPKLFDWELENGSSWRRGCRKSRRVTGTCIIYCPAIKMHYNGCFVLWALNRCHQSRALCDLHLANITVHIVNPTIEINF